MKKFTIFSIILAALVTIISLELIFSGEESDGVESSGEVDSNNNSALLGGSDPNQLASILTVDIDGLAEDDFENEESPEVPDDIEDLEDPEVVSDEIEKPEDIEEKVENEEESDDEKIDRGGIEDGNSEEELGNPLGIPVLIRNDMVQSAGFETGYLVSESHDGFIFKNIPLSSLENYKLEKYLVSKPSTENENGFESLAKIYIFEADLNGNINSIYTDLKSAILEESKNSESSLGTVQVNETNEFGLNSFYMNDSLRPNVAFLTVRIDSYIFAFSYPKDNHFWVKNMIKLLEWENN